MRARPAGLLLGAVLWVALGANALASTPEACAPWPGEPAPLPQLGDPDPVLARWAELRAAELAERAEALESANPLEAHRLWRRFQCFDPGSPELRRALHRTRPVRLHRLELSARDAGRDPQGLGWAVLAEPLAPSGRAAAAPTPRSRLLSDIDRWIRRTEQSVQAARFEEALAAAGQARSKLGRLRQQGDLQERWVRLELAEATVHIARGRGDEASACAARALDRQPDLALDETRYSPKLVRLFTSARSPEPRP